MGEPSSGQRQRVTEEELRAEELEPKIKALGGFLTSAALRNGTTARMDPGVADLLAEAIIRWQDGDVWEAGRWTPRGEVMPTPDAGDVLVESLAEGLVVKMTHRPTGLVSLGEDVQETWNDLRRKVKDHGDE
ncbi:MAG: hypothetical protein ACTH0J_10570 [Corynebacterium variabile]|uniref:hypothetical protein n=1 Tax=Corynebacterium variabile TaxID=1727 RepID=UPI003F8FD5EB